MHLELAIPALVPAREALQAAHDSARLASLELLVARGRIARSARQSFEHWLAQAFGLGPDELPAGALSAIADGLEPDALEGRWMRADPAHLHLGREDFRLVPSAAFALDAGEALALCETVNGHFGERLRLTPTRARPGCWVARCFGADLPSSPPPVEAAGDDVDAHLRAPGSAAGTAQTHALLNEIQMLLHEHPVNEAREARGEPAVNSLWFWGAGAAPPAAGGPWQSLSTDDPLALGLARLAGIRVLAPQASADSWLAKAPTGGRHLVVLDALRAPQALLDEEAYVAALHVLEARWFAPLLDALRTQRIGMLSVRVPDAAEALSIEVVRGDLRRFWRRPRALAPWKD